MACYRPLKAIVLGKTPEGKKNIVFDSTAHDTGFYHGKYISEENRLSLPCGQCVGCRIQKSREWADRLMMELQYHDEAWFLTLTYNNEHARPAADVNGEVCDWLTLQKKDFQLFMKRLRKAVGGTKLRFYACGEYGTETFRPHYHAIIFGLHLDDLKPYKKSELGFMYYTSDFLQRVWSEKVDYYDENGQKQYRYEPIGYVIVGAVTWETCAYTARYVTKKLTGDLSWYYDYFGLEKPFSLMSRKPGIAGDYFEEHKDEIFKKDFINISTEKGGLKFKPPKYFERLYAIDHETEIDDIKKCNQKMAINAKKLKLAKTDLSYDELLMVQERNFENKIKSLRRIIV